MTEQTKQASSPASQASSKINRQEMTAQVSQDNNETAQTAISTKVRAEIESSLIMARKFPRNEADIRVNVLKTCQIPSFADKAKYKKPQGKTKDEATGKWIQNYVIGPSIRLAEEFFRQWGNIIMDTTILFEDSQKRIVGVRIMDLQSLAISSGQFIIEKTVERKDPKFREIVLERVNSSNEKVYVVVATEDEILSKQNNILSKYRRNLIIQLIPTYILQDALEEVDKVVRSGIKEDPEKSKKIVIDNFSRIGVMPSDLEKYIGHPIVQLIPDEILELKELYQAIAEKETTWAEAMEERFNPDKQNVETATADMPPRLLGEDEWAYEDRVKKLKTSGEFKAGDAKTHSHVSKPLNTQQ